MASTLSADILDRLATGIAELTTSVAWQRYLDVQQRFHRYSFNNTLLIALQRPDATQVAGFRKWLEMGRCVRKGEKGLAILAPIVKRTKVTDDDGEERTIISDPNRFRVVHVFDIAQTDGDDLPEPPCHRLQGGDSTGAYAQLVAVANSLGFTVEDAHFAGAKNGDCTFGERRIRVEVRNAPAQRVKTLVHELAHAMLHENATDRGIAELEAESVAYVVCSALGIDSQDYSFGYVAGWGGGEEAISAIRACGSRIQKTASAILAGLEESTSETAA